MFAFTIKSLRTKMLLWVCCASLVPNIIGGAYIAQLVMERSEADYIGHAREASNNILYNLDNTFLTPVENMVSLLAQDQRVINMGPGNLKNYTQLDAGIWLPHTDPLENTLQQYFTAVKSNHSKMGTIFLGSAWGGYMETPPFNPGNSYDPRLRSWYQRGTEHRGQIVTTDPYITAVTGQMVISVTQAVEQGEQPVGVVGIMLYLTEFQKKVSNTQIGKNGYFMVINPAKKFVVSPKHSEWLLKSIEEINSGPLTKLEENVDMIVHYEIDNTDQLALITPPDKRGWRIIAVIDRGEFMADAIAIRNIIISVYCITLTLVLLAITYATTCITRPLRFMTRATRQMADGNLEITDLTVGTHDELGQLAQSFSKMAKKLQKSYTELEMRVEERTQELNAGNQELLAMNEELIETLDRLNETQDQLVKSSKMAALGGLVAGVAHEINTPAGVALTATSYLAKITQELTELYENKKLKSGDFEKYIEDCQEATTLILFNLKRADQLIRSFKQVAVDQTSEARRLFNVKNYIEETLLSLSPKLRKTNHIVDIHCDERLEVNSFPGGFYQILTNLILNSLTHAYEGDQTGRIVITVVHGEGNLLLHFSDDGKGMTKHILEKIFDPFFTTRRDRGGSGLGLHIVYNIVTQQFDGNIECQSSLGGGTIFVISLPLERKDSGENTIT